MLEPLGQGGMGVVVAAYDPDLDRKVALKVLKPSAPDGSTSDADRERMLREARAMAKLDHAHVLKVLEAGTVGDRVFIAVELAAGGTLREWMARDHSWREVVAKFIDAGSGLWAAHQAGLVHRDFKPENVLLSANGEVHVADFGLVGLYTHGLATTAPGTSADDDLRLTQPGSLMGTPSYMAPEQHRRESVGPAADQFAFCVSLWEALYGERPFRGATYNELSQNVLDGNVQSPPAGMKVPRWLHDIVARGLSVSPDKRWSTMGTLLDTLRRDPGRRRRRALAVAIPIVMLALAGVAISVARQRHRANVIAACEGEGARMTETWNESRASKIGQAFTATGISYAADTWTRSRARLELYAGQWRVARTKACKQADLDGTLARDAARGSRACMDEHRDHVEALLEELAKPDAKLVQKAAMATASLPLLDACTDEARLRHQAAVPVEAVTRERARTLRMRLSRAAAALATGRLDESLAHAQAVLDEATRVAWKPLAIDARFAVARAETSLGRYESARITLEDAFFEAGASGRDDVALRIASLLTYVVGYQLARHDEGLRWGRTSQMLATKLGRTDDLDVAELLSSVGAVHQRRGDYANASKQYEQALAIKEKILGSEHPEVGRMLNNLATTSNERGHHAKALVEHERALTIREKSLGDQHPDVAASLNNISHVHRLRAELAKSLDACERALTIFERALGHAHPYVAFALANVGRTYLEMGEHGKALASFERALAIREKIYGAAHPAVAASLNDVGDAYFEQGAYAKTLALSERAREIQEKADGPDHPDGADALDSLGRAHLAIGDPVKAVMFHERAVTILEKAHGIDNRAIAAPLDNLGRAYLQRGEHAKALASFERSLAIQERVFGGDHPGVAAALEGVAMVRYRQADYQMAIAAYERALAIREPRGIPTARLATTRFELARALWDSGIDRVRAIALAKAAKEALEDSRVRGEVSQWLAARSSN